MNKFIKNIMFITLLSMGFTSLVAAKELHFGDSIDQNAKIKVSTLMATPKEYVDKNVTIEGLVVAVCKKRGCWMTIASDEKYQKLRIKVRDGDMVFPMSAKGRKALATGKFTKVELSMEQTINYYKRNAKHDGKKFDPASVTEPFVYYQVVPVGVTILG